MAFIDGQTLKHKIGERPLPLKEALDIATQVAEGLHAAHKKGIVHRDIKSANVMVDTEGRATILDFGLARFVTGTKITKTGTTMGTPAYMSPEQVRGEAPDHRTDIWSLGVGLYEMVTGQLPFQGDTDQAAALGILNCDPEPPSALRSGLPAEIEWIAAKALAKDPKERYQHVEEMAVDLRGIRRKVDQSKPLLLRQPPRRPTYLTLISHVLLAIAVAAITALLLRPQRTELPLRRFALSTGTEARWPSISPDGRHIAYVAEEKLWVRGLDREQPRELEGTEGANRPFWSPGSDWIGFAVGGELRKIPVAGGQSSRLCGVLLLEGGTWSPDGGSIVFATWAPGLQEMLSDRGQVRELYEVPAAGGEPRLLIENQGSEGLSMFDAPHFLPSESGDRVLLFEMESPRGPRVVLHNLETGHQVVLADGAQPVYSPSGHIIYQRSEDEAGLWALPFSIETMEVTGEPFGLFGEGMSASAARDGTLVYVDRGEGNLKQLVWRDRNGKKLGVAGQPQFYIRQQRLSPNANRVAVGAASRGNNDIWVHDVERGVATRVTSDPAFDCIPVWSPAGERIAFGSSRGGSYDVLVKRADTTGAPEPLVATSSNEIPIDWSPDGKYLLFARGKDVWHLEIDRNGSGSEIPFLEQTRGGGPGGEARFSPDGRFVAYVSNESGRDEIYIRPFPAGEGKWQVSSDGGYCPRWRRDGRELFFLESSAGSARSNLISLAVTSQPGFAVAGPLRRLFSWRHPGPEVPVFDVSADGQRFLFAEFVEPESPPVIRVIQNWFAEYRDRYPRE